MIHEQIPTFDCDTPSVALTQILEWLEERIDLDHLVNVEERHIKALQWEPVVRPPVTFSAPVAEPFAVYPYSEAFRDATKMLVNELIGPYAALGPSPSIVNSVLIKDDYPLQIRAFYGVGLFVSLFGARSEVVGDNFPWTRPIGLEALKRHVARGVPDLNSELFRRVLDTMAYYKEVLSPYPKCRQAIHITQPDLQGPFENAAHMWGSDIFTAFYDCPDFMRELLDFLAETWVLACRKFAAESTEAVREDFIYLHFAIVKGKGLLKDDSTVMLSPSIYSEFIRPMNEKVFHALGAGGIHWCGNGDQWRSELVDTKGLACIDWGNPDMIDLPAWAEILRERRLPVARMEWKASEFAEVAPTKLFPTGASFTVMVDDFEQAKAMIQKGVT
jgi:hypothetical protein